ncbi:MAG: MFS transporter [Burkholderiaceae bacterium]
MTYSIALAALAVAVLAGHKLYCRMTPSTYVMMTGALAAAGCVIAALSPSKALVWLGFGLVFGGANGLGYGYALQFSGQALPERKGFAMGIVTAAYAFGAVVFPVPLRVAVQTGGWAGALLFLAVCLLLFSALSAWTLSRSQGIFPPDTGHAVRFTRAMGQKVVWLWFCYCGAVTAGLMVMGHATGLAEARSSSAFWIIAAPIVIASANMGGSLLGGVLTDRMGGRSVLAFFAMVSGVSVLTMAATANLTAALIGLAMVGFAYGGTVAGYPAYISHCFGAAAGTVAYGRVFTAWAVAGLLGPYLAGLLFDRYQNYQMALILAAIAAAISLLLLMTKARDLSVGASRS